MAHASACLILPPVDSCGLLVEFPEEIAPPGLFDLLVVDFPL